MSVTPLPADAPQRIALASLVIAVKALARQTQKGGGNVDRRNKYVALLIAGVEDAIEELRDQ